MCFKGPPSVELRDQKIVIEIPIEYMACIVDNIYHTVAVDNNEVFAQEIVQALQDEQEDGTTLVHEMLDAAATKAVDEGADGVIDN